MVGGEAEDMAALSSSLSSAQYWVNRYREVLTLERLLFHRARSQPKAARSLSGLQPSSDGRDQAS